MSPRQSASRQSAVQWASPLVDFHDHVDVTVAKENLHDCVKLLVDTGCSECFTFCKSDFVAGSLVPLPPGQTITGITSEPLEKSHSGLLRYEVIDDHCNVIALTCMGYLVPGMKSRLWSPQFHLDYLTKHNESIPKVSIMNKGIGYVWSNGNKLTVPYDPVTNMPLMRAYTNSHAAELAVANMKDAMRNKILSKVSTSSSPNNGKTPSISLLSVMVSPVTSCPSTQQYRYSLPTLTPTPTPTRSTSTLNDKLRAAKALLHMKRRGRSKMSHPIRPTQSRSSSGGEFDAKMFGAIRRGAKAIMTLSRMTDLKLVIAGIRSNPHTKEKCKSMVKHMLAQMTDSDERAAVRTLIRCLYKTLKPNHNRNESHHAT